MDRGAPASSPSQVEIASYRRERIRQMREEWSHESPLLKLPGELRNRIYEYVTEPAEVTLVLSSLPGDTGFASSGSVDWSSSKRTSLGLTQTCREIRAEVLPLHRKAYTIQTKLQYNISVRELDRAALQKHDQVNGPVTHVVTSRPFTLDILAVLRQNKGVHIEYGSYNAQHPVKQAASRLINGIFEASRKTRAAFFMRIKAQSMTLTMPGIRPRLAIIVRPQGREFWMPYIGTRTPQSTNPFVEQWLNDVGLDSIGLKPCNLDIA